MKKFEVTVTRVDEYEIEIDETIFTEEWRKDWEKVFFPIPDLSDIAKHLAQYQARFGGSFIEGFGHIKRNGRDQSYDENTKSIEGLNIKIIDEDNDIEIVFNEMKP